MSYIHCNLTDIYMSVTKNIVVGDKNAAFATKYSKVSI